MTDRVQAFESNFKTIHSLEAWHRLQKGEEVWACNYAADTLEDGEDDAPHFTTISKDDVADWTVSEFNDIGPFAADATTVYYDYMTRVEYAFGDHTFFVEVQAFSDVAPTDEDNDEVRKKILAEALNVFRANTGAKQPDNYWLAEWWEAM